MKELCCQFRHEAHKLLIFAQYSQFTIRLRLLCAICFDLLPSAPIWWVFFLKNESGGVWLLQKQSITGALKTFCLLETVCSHQPAAFLPLLNIAQVNCTTGCWPRPGLAGTEAAPADLPLYIRANQRLPAAGFRVLWRDFVSKNSYWWCVSDWLCGSSCGGGVCVNDLNEVIGVMLIKLAHNTKLGGNNRIPNKLDELQKAPQPPKDAILSVQQMQQFNR